MRHGLRIGLGWALLASAAGCGSESTPAATCEDLRCGEQHRECDGSGEVAVCGACLPGYHEDGGACL
ncbi:MAG: hypothetical protein JXR96_01960, partial [Deltaproteobacteria bacterium]|nr:hypothetical protein [Deltaproteobacteria bacterium]